MLEEYTHVLLFWIGGFFGYAIGYAASKKAIIERELELQQGTNQPH